MSLRIDCCCNLYTGLLSCNEIAGDLTREEKKNYDGKSIPSQAKRFMIKFGLNEGTKSIAVADEGCIDIYNVFRHCGNGALCRIGSGTCQILL